MGNIDAAAILRHLTAPLSAEDLASRLGLTVPETLAALHEAWWQIVPTAGDWNGWRYAPRQVLSRTVRMSEPQVKQYADGATTGRERTIFTRETANDR